MDNNQQIISWLNKEVNNVRKGRDRNVERYCASSLPLQYQYGNSSLGSVPRSSDSPTTYSNLMYVTPKLKVPNVNMMMEVPAQRNYVDHYLSSYHPIQVPCFGPTPTPPTISTVTNNHQKIWTKDTFQAKIPKRKRNRTRHL